jgi:hypothetical protein
MKTCHTCGVEKPLESFYKYKRNKDGHLGVCKRCFLAKQQMYKARKKAANRWLWTTG